MSNVYFPVYVIGQPRKAEIQEIGNHFKCKASATSLPEENGQPMLYYFNINGEDRKGSPDGKWLHRKKATMDY